MEEYLYISEAKIESYFPHVRSEFTTKTKVKESVDTSVGPLKGGLSTEQELQPRDDKFTHLIEIENHLRTKNRIHPPETPYDWIEGKGEAIAVKFPDHANLLFLAIDQPSHLLVLAGSAHHQIGFTKPSQINCRYSWFPDLLSALDPVISGYLPFFNTDLEYRSDFLQSGIAFREKPWIATLREISNQILKARSPRFRIRYLAEVLSTGRPEGERRFTIATPLFISRLPTS